MYGPSPIANSEMLALMTLGLVITALVIIGAVVAWGARNGTLRESDQERCDRRFIDILKSEGLS